ncbi:AAA family ATPase [Halostreptopolyspora alba]|uniref:AAA family ATPase n=1 Tax=Halostreptopolyspora alba TaxID=2487137 RepID=UPI00269CCFE9
MRHSVTHATIPAEPRGRTEETARLASILGDARRGRSGSLILLGAPGAGKSTLLSNAHEDAAGHLRLFATGVGPEADLPYAGLQQLLLPVAGRAGELPEEQRTLVRRMIDTGRVAETDRFALSVAVLELLRHLGRAEPVAAFVDDAHLIDEPSLEALTFVVRRLRREDPVTLLCSARDAHSKPVLPGVPALTLGPLPKSAVAKLLSDVALVEPTDTVRADLLRAARGNPGAARSIVDELTSDQLCGREPLPSPLPLGRDLIERYLEHVRDLPEPTLRLLLLAAADPELAVDTLVRAMPDTGGSVADLEPAEERGIIRVRGGRVVFTDPLLRDAYYQDAPLHQRRSAHARLAETLDEQGEAGPRAWHRAAAARGPDPRLAAELVSRVDTMCESHGYEASSVALERAAELTPVSLLRCCRLSTAAHHAWLAGDPHRAHSLLDRNRPYTVDGQSRGVVELILGHISLRGDNAIDTHIALREAAETLAPHDRHLALRAMVRSAEAASLAGDRRRHSEAAKRVADLSEADDPPAILLGAAYIIGADELFHGDYEAAVGPLRRAVALAGRTGGPTELIWACICALLLGDEPSAHTLATRAVEQARARGADALIPQALEFLVYAEFWTGRHASASGHCLTGLRLARETGQTNGVTHLTAALAMLSAIQGDEETCAVRARTATEQGTRNSLGLPVALSTWALAFLDLSKGAAGPAAHRLRSLPRCGPGQSHWAVQMLAIPHFVEAAVLHEQPARATAPLAQYERWATATGSANGLALLARCRALLTSGDEARDLFEESLRRHRSGGHNGVEYARTHLLYGAALRRQRSPGRAVEHLNHALEMFENLDARMLAGRARAELRATGDSRREGSHTSVSSLSAQQEQIAELVAAGATNREVAAQLYISPRTVEHHLRNIFDRLNVRSRVELSRLMSRG